VISEGFREHLLHKGAPAEKVSVHPVWADPEVVRPLPHENGFRRSLGLEGKFILLYAGNLGLNSCLEDIMTTAEILREDRQIHWLIVGEGVKKSNLERMSRQKGLENVTFLPYQPRAAFVEMLSAANVGLVTLNAEMSFTCLPSKIFNIMSCERPVLAVTPEGSEIADLVYQAGCGVNAPPGDPERLADVVRDMQREHSWLEAMGRSGRQFVQVHYSRQVCLDRYESFLKQISRR
jgi:colanic acid biosynthesis glycosyl transferase WcaI